MPEIKADNIFDKWRFEVGAKWSQLSRDSGVSYQQVRRMAMMTPDEMLGVRLKTIMDLEDAMGIPLYSMLKKYNQKKGNQAPVTPRASDPVSLEKKLLERLLSFANK